MTGNTYDKSGVDSHEFVEKIIKISSTTSSEQCAICLDPIVNEQECINNCGHKFCKPCMDQYLDLGKIECPLCRQPIQYFEYNSEHFRLILKKVNQIY